MASVHDVRSSKFLKKEDVGKGALVTIRSVGQANVAKEGAEEEMKWTISFDEFEKPMVLNSTNAQLLGKAHRMERRRAAKGDQAAVIERHALFDCMDARSAGHRLIHNLAHACRECLRLAIP